MEALIALSIGVLTGCGVYLTLRARTFPVVLGLTLLSYAVNLFLFATGRLVVEGRKVRLRPAPGGACSSLPNIPTN
jgi:multicomponent K+:H+ antiporter subunit C